MAARFDGVLQPGAAFNWEKGGLKIISTVLELTPMHRIVWTGPAQGIDAVNVWELTAAAQGVLVHTEESWSGDVVRTNTPSLRPILNGALQDWLTRLKTTREANVSTAKYKRPSKLNGRPDAHTLKQSLANASHWSWIQPVDATSWLNRSAGVS